MPARAFLLFGLAASYSCPAYTTRFQCPRGHFCFSDMNEGERDGSPNQVSMPARAFLLFGRPRTRRGSDTPFVGFNAREGIFAFRTLTMFNYSPIVQQSFNALAGIFAFRTLLLEQ